LMNCDDKKKMQCENTVTIEETGRWIGPKRGLGKGT
jgi:hypothetical protein